MPAKDDNAQNLLFGVSHRDGVTPVAVRFQSNGRILTDDTTTIEFDPSIIASQTENDVPLIKGTSTDDGVTALPWVVNEDTGAVLVDRT